MQQSKNSTNTESDDSDVPSVSVEKEKVLNISRDDAIKSSKRINFENENTRFESKKISIASHGFEIKEKGNVVHFNGKNIVKIK